MLLLLLHIAELFSTRIKAALKAPHRGHSPSAPKAFGPGARVAARASTKQADTQKAKQHKPIHVARPSWSLAAAHAEGRSLRSLRSPCPIDLPG